MTATIQITHKRRLIDVLRKLYITRRSDFLFLCEIFFSIPPSRITRQRLPDLSDRISAWQKNLSPNVSRNFQGNAWILRKREFNYADRDKRFEKY